MRIGIMGGTFDPIHVGHLLAAELAREAEQLDEVWFMPAFVPPHKQNGAVAGPEDRLAMARLAVEGNPHFKVTDIEIAKQDTSYTIDTVELLTGRYPADSFCFIIGADMVMYLPHWRRIEDIVRRIRFVGLARPGYTLALEELPEVIRSRVTLAAMPLVELSSTEIRRRLGSGETVRYMVPEPVRLYMEGKGLYA
ncbi:nicotinate-nucleotide adenylyltransferase [Paenibacillus sp. YN15]|uniref:nicotinate-nucleotide adenylyltransferase n=1 Tax=Paenibacillus sp. YN15 TaxID=1742774 RepID=UPI000DCB7657|nr:nicotinate-nucleotide adenylyltransferase [Paenibacillus sp. YN15]RAV01680.1 nicotinate-nucleotide adenylyltransferase [Paenibacillus sp. YN15]